MEFKEQPGYFLEVSQQCDFKDYKFY